MKFRPIDAGDSAGQGVDSLREFDVLERPAAHQAGLLLVELKLTIAHGQDVGVFFVPSHCRDVAAFGQRTTVAPQEVEVRRFRAAGVCFRDGWGEEL